MDAPSTTLVRPALELAWAVARAGERRRPPVAVPGPLRPLTRFARLPDRALGTVQQVLEDDDSFRERVAAAADEDGLGRLPWLWLTRPEGWEDELAVAAVESEAKLQVEEDRRADRAARRRLSVVEASLQRTEGELLEARAAAAALGAELTELRQERRAETDGATRDRAAVAEARAAAEAAEHRAGQAEALVAGLEQRIHAAEDGRRQAEEAARRLHGQLEAARHELGVIDRTRQAEVGRAAATTSALGSAVGEAAVAADRLGHALARAAHVLERSAAPQAAPVEPPPGPGPSAPVRETRGKRDPGAPRAVRPRRVPVRLPAALLDDSVEAAAWLVRVQGAVLIVDGYNVTLAAWSGRALPDQRHRLVTALAELSMRTGVEVEVVFDGDEDHAHPLRSLPARRAVRTVFSPQGVDADEVIIERVGLLPVDRPVVVATDDRRVRDEVHRAGANLLSTRQLVAVLGRSPSPGP